MRMTQTAKAENVFQRRMLFDGVRRQLKGHRGLWGLALVGIGIAIVAAANWSWLLASGTAAVLLSALPCLVMCGLGLCMNKLGSVPGTGAVKSAAADESADSSPVTSNSLATSEVSCWSEAHQIGPAVLSTKNPSTQQKEKHDA